MNRTIFLRELRVGLLQEFVSVGALLSLFAACGWLVAKVYGQPIREMVEDILLFTIVLTALLAFSSGARTFTAESRRRQELFFFTLPISRKTLWLSLIGGRLVAAFPVPALLVLANDLLHDGLPGLRHLGSAGMAVFLALFASGACLSLFFRRDTVAYFAGALIAFPVIAQTLTFTMSGFSPLSLHERFSTLSVGLVATAFLGLSWFFFYRGEVLARTRQIANAMFLGVTLAMILLLIGAGMQSPLLQKFMGPWTQDPDPRIPPPRWETETGRLVSAGGRYLAVAETLSRRPGIWKVTIVETATGRRVGERQWSDLRWVSWDAREEVLRIVCSDPAFPFFWRIGGEPVTAWVGLTPGGRVLTRTRFRQILAAASQRNGPDILVEFKDNRSRLILLDKPWSTPILVESSWLESWLILPLGQGTVVWADKKWYVEDGRARELSRDAEEAFLKTMSSRSADLIQRVEQEISLPGHEHDPSAIPMLIAPRSGLYLLVRFQFHTATPSGRPAVQYRHFSYLPGSGAVKPLPALDSALAGDIDIRLAYLDERTAVWRPEKGETWKILQDGQIRTLWPPQPSE